MKTFDIQISRSGKETRAVDNVTVSLILSEQQMIHINVSILYANTTGLIVVVAVVVVGTCKHPIFRGNGQSGGFFSLW